MLLESSAHEICHGTWIFVNGALIGTVAGDRVDEFVKRIKTWRRIQDIPFSTSITYYKEHREIHIVLDSGCCIRPVFVLENIYKFNEVYEMYKNNRYLLWDKMISHGIIEYIDKEEESTLQIATTWNELKKNSSYTHIEIHPIVILGISASFVPLSNHDQAPRITYGSAMLKQAVGLVGLNAEQRFDTSGIHELFYPQRPLVSSFTEIQTRLTDLPYGNNVIIAIMSYTGYNQEDSLILNSASIDRGLFRSLYFRTYKDIARNVGSEQETFESPNENEIIGMKRADYSKLSSIDGFPDLHQEIKQDDVIIGKVLHLTDLNNNNNINNEEKKDRSTIYKNKEPARIDKITTSLTKEGSVLVNVKTRSHRIPVVGDKFSSRHGQKGVCSLILNPEDMPFTSSGQIPDMIMNPHAIPSRMTLSQLIETVLGKTAVMVGKIGDGTAFNHTNEEDGKSMIEHIQDLLHQYGFNRHGNEVMYNGMTGEMLNAQIFIGPCYYMRLKHMVIDKIHARATGPRQILTRQPVEGRAREGGLRFGEMERDALISHGAAAVLQDRLLDVSDRYETVVCQQCGMFAIPAPPKTKHTWKLLGRNITPWCKRCNTGTHVKNVVMPYAFKVLYQDLEAFHISMKMELKKSSY
jgi:DNA-directed RNA polymerase II subunit RPB2